MNLRSCGLALVGALIVASLAACGSETDTDNDVDQSSSIGPAANAATEAALTWLDEHPTDLGAQADLHLALATLEDETRRQTIVENFEKGADAYINTSYEYDGAAYSGISSGAAAKTLYVAAASDLDPTAFGEDELDLLNVLAERMVSDGPSRGRLADLALKDGKPDPASNYANSFGQAYAVRGLAEADNDVADDLYVATKDFLLAQQCAAGFFRLYFHPDPEADDQSCDGADPVEEPPAGDTTALVLLLLDDIAEDDPEVAAALDRAEEWLSGIQEDDGTFPGEPTGAETNTNSVGIAGWALGERGDDEAAAAAAIWVRQHQLAGLPCDNAAQEHMGAVALNAQARADAVENGIDDATLFEWQGATVQATAVLGWAPAGSPELNVTSTTTDTGIQVEVAGAAPGEPVCADAGGVHEGGFADPTGSVTLDFADALDALTVVTLEQSQEHDVR